MKYAVRQERSADGWWRADGEAMRRLVDSVTDPMTDPMIGQNRNLR